jgi:small-conductance mechanosensitive channel
VTPAASAILQVATTATAAAQAGPPLWVTAVQAAVAVAIVAAVGTAATRLLRGAILRAGGSRSVATSITQWMGLFTLLAAVGVLSTEAGVSSYLTALTVSGIAGLALSLALQNTISNVISGVLLQHDGVIRLGDDVQYGVGGVRGEVAKLSLRTTWLRTRDGVVIAISNSTIAAGPILNYTSMARLEKKLDG